jgi:hypothetical protein
LVTQLQRESLSLRGSISSILNNDYQGFYAWGNAALRLWTEYRLRLSPIDWDTIGGLPDALLSDVELPPILSMYIDVNINVVKFTGAFSFLVLFHT